MVILSKTRFSQTSNCALAGWLAKNKPDESKDSKTAKAKKNDGQAVGILAQKYFDDIYVVENTTNKSKMMADTKAAIARGEKNIAEATFSKGGCFCQVDILHLNENGNYDIIEVKHNCNLKKYHFWDIAFQYHTLKLAGISVENAYLMHINNKYVRSGALDLKQLFVLEDVTFFCEENEEEVEAQIVKAKAVLASSDEPVVEMGRQCEECWECPYKKYCISKLPEKEQDIFKIDGLTWLQKVKTAKTGILPKDKGRLTLLDDEVICNKIAIEQFLEKLYFPLYLLDFESVQQTVPQYDSQKPWQQLPFQYSLHVMKSWDEVEVEHHEFLGDGKTDPRKALAEQLLQEIPRGCQVMAYNDSFEKSILKLLAEALPEYSEELMEMRENFIDLMIPFKNGEYYKGIMKASYSIKKVLPALFPDDEELDYHNLNSVQNGVDAQEAYTELATLEGEEYETKRKDMLDYCKLDTFAMVKILRFLHSVVSK